MDMMNILEVGTKVYAVIDKHGYSPYIAIDCIGKITIRRTKIEYWLEFSDHDVDDYEVFKTEAEAEGYIRNLPKD